MTFAEMQEHLELFGFIRDVAAKVSGSGREVCRLQNGDETVLCLLENGEVKQVVLANGGSTYGPAHPTHALEFLHIGLKLRATTSNDYKTHDHWRVHWKNLQPGRTVMEAMP